MVNKRDRLTAVFQALADPTRRRILVRLQQGECRVTALAQPFRISLPAVSRHLRVLERAKLIKRHHSGRVHLIRAHAPGLKDAQKWIGRWAAFWDARFDEIDELLKKTDPGKDPQV